MYHLQTAVEVADGGEELPGVHSPHPLPKTSSRASRPTCLLVPVWRHVLVASALLEQCQMGFHPFGYLCGRVTALLGGACYRQFSELTLAIGPAVKVQGYVYRFYRNAASGALIAHLRLHRAVLVHDRREIRVDVQRAHLVGRGREQLFQFGESLAVVVAHRRPKPFPPRARCSC